MIDHALAGRLAQLACANITTEYPNKLDHLLDDDDAVLPPRRLHPVFYGSYDWHSSVHMHWLLVRLLRLAPGHAAAQQSMALLTEQLNATRVAGELAYLARPSARGFERTYGWAWLLALEQELEALARTACAAFAWRDALAPLAQAFVARYRDFLPLAQFPIRAGTHANSAFGLLLPLIYARRHGDADFAALLEAQAMRWFARDHDYPFRYEPSGADFLSAGLVEAALVSALPAVEFATWWARFRGERDTFLAWLQPVPVSDRSDAQLVHLDGLNLSRAWCCRRIAQRLAGDEAQALEAAGHAHLEAGLAHVVQAHYVGTHWLASFAALALGTADPDDL